MKSLLFLAVILIIGINFYSFNFLITLLVISFLIFFHELGHFLAAKSLKVSVLVFSIGFGKALIEREFKGTKYRISALPLGGYVKLKGQDDLAPAKECLDSDSYSVLSPLKKIYILFAGPFFNIILAFLLYIIIANLGVNKLAPIIGKIEPNSAAALASLKANDEIVSINGVQIKSFEQIASNLRLEPLQVVIKREGRILNLTLTPQLGEGRNEFMQAVQKPLLGVYPSTKQVTLYHSGFDSIKYAFDESVNASLLIVKGIAKLISAQLDARNLGGVITMVDLTSKAADSGVVVLLLITALISINLGILNLLPIPMLDGGHILFNLYEMIFRRKVSLRVFEYLSYGGMAVLLALMVFATYNDLVRIFSA